MGHVQFIGYQIKTATEGDPTRRIYPGYANPRMDLEERCKIMADAIITAQKSPLTNPAALKLFVAPEFFFRGGAAGAYDVTLISEINRIMDRYLAAPVFQNWIFILGTAIGSLPGEKPTRTEIFNIALVRKGGVKVAGTLGTKGSLASGEKDSLLIYKEYVSYIDYQGKHYEQDTFYNGPEAGRAYLSGKRTRLMPTRGARKTGSIPLAGTPNVPGEKRFWTPSFDAMVETEQNYRAGKVSKAQRDIAMKGRSYEITEESATGLGGGSIFEMGGYRFVTEICLDHAEERAKDAGTQKIDFHIVTSCGMTPEYIVARNGGYFFLVDGSTDSDDRVTLIKKEVGKARHLDNFDIIDMNNPSYWRHHTDTGDKLFESGKGTVHISRLQLI